MLNALSNKQTYLVEHPLSNISLDLPLRLRKYQHQPPGQSLLTTQAYNIKTHRPLFMRVTKPPTINRATEPKRVTNNDQMPNPAILFATFVAVTRPHRVLASHINRLGHKPCLYRPLTIAASSIQLPKTALECPRWYPAWSAASSASGSSAAGSFWRSGAFPLGYRITPIATIWANRFVW